MSVRYDFGCQTTSLMPCGSAAPRLPLACDYATLIDRAKQLVQLAAQMEAAMLSALEKADAEAYTLLKARQDVSLAQSRVQLQALQVTEANDAVTLATLQQSRAQFQQTCYQGLVNVG